MGKAYLIGTGPGDEELVTVKAIRAIEKCDVLLYDRLSSDSLLRYAKKGCEIYYCGKKPGNHYKTQDEINEVLVSHAKEGKTVGRVKGGDPYVFGRGGEEALRLAEEGIEFEVIPGVTSPIAVLNYAGIPMTQRGIAQSFHVFTAMTAEKLDIDWEAVAKLEGTVVFMMGLANLAKIRDGLLGAGISEKTPAAVIMEGTTSRQKNVIGTIGDIVEKAEEAKLKSPCIIVVGEVVSLSEQLDWYSKKPLHGKHVCITRSKRQSKETREKLLDLGAEVTEINSIETEAVAGSLEGFREKLEDYDYIVLSSVNAVDYFFDSLIEMGYDIRKIKAEFPAIGEKTEEALRARGIIPTIVADHFVMDSLLDEIKKRALAGNKVLYPKSELSGTSLEEELTSIGCEVDSTILYKVKCGSRRGYESLEGVDIIMFTSPSTVRNTIEMFGKDAVKSKRVVAIGPITELELKNRGIDCDTSENYTLDGMIEALKN